MTLVFNIEGVNPPIPSSPSVQYIFPKYKQQLREEDLQMSYELQDFYNKNDKIMLVAFGT